MLLSDAIRAGSSLRAQGYGALFEKYLDEMRSCALGAACEVVVGLPEEGYWSVDLMDRLRYIFPELYSATLMPSHMPPGVTLYGVPFPMDLRHAIEYLNDAKMWPRERIADWLDTLPFEFTDYQPDEALVYPLPDLIDRLLVPEVA